MQDSFESGVQYAAGAAAETGWTRFLQQATSMHMFVRDIVSPACL
jgi:hypothetical protein